MDNNYIFNVGDAVKFLEKPNFFDPVQISYGTLIKYEQKLPGKNTNFGWVIKRLNKTQCWVEIKSIAKATELEKLLYF